MELIAKQYWNDVQFNSAEIKNEHVPCLGKKSPYDDYSAMYKEIYIVYDQFHLSAPWTFSSLSKQSILTLLVLVPHLPFVEVR